MIFNIETRKYVMKFWNTNTNIFRYARAERDLKQARPYGLGAQSFYEVTEIEPMKDEKKELYIAMTSDRGYKTLFTFAF